MNAIILIDMWYPGDHYMEIWYVTITDSYMKTFKPASGQLLDKALQKHHLYTCAKCLMEERFPDLIHQCKVTVLLSVILSVHQLESFIVPTAKMCTHSSTKLHHVI